MEEEIKENVQEKESQEIEEETQEETQEETTTDTATDDTVDAQQQLLESLSTLSEKLDTLNANLLKAQKSAKQQTQSQTKNAVVGSNVSYSEWMNNQLSDTISNDYISLTELDYS